MSQQNRKAAIRACMAEHGVNYTTAMRRLTESSDSHRVVIGHDGDGQPVVLDFTGVAHTWIAGECGAGKTTVARTIVTSVLAAGGEVLVIDPDAGGADFGLTAGDVELADTAATLIEFTEARTDSSRRVVVVEVTGQLGEDLVAAVNQVLREGRSKGVSVVLSTQRGTGRELNGLSRHDMLNRVLMGPSDDLTRKAVLLGACEPLPDPAASGEGLALTGGAGTVAFQAVNTSVEDVAAAFRNARSRRAQSM